MRNVLIPKSIINYLGGAFLKTNNELGGFLVYDCINKINGETIFMINKVYVNESENNSSYRGILKSLIELRDLNPLDERYSILFHAHSRMTGELVKEIDVKPSHDDFLLPTGSIELTPQYGLSVLIKPNNNLIGLKMPNDINFIDFITIDSKNGLMKKVLSKA